MFSPIKPLHFVLSCTHSFFRPSLFKSCLTHSSHVFLLLPLLFVRANHLNIRSKCPSHLNLPRLTTSVTPSTESTTKHLFNSLLDVLFLRLTHTMMQSS